MNGNSNLTFTVNGINTSDNLFFRWYKNNILQTTNNSNSYTLNCNDGDIISCTLENKDKCQLESDVVSTTANIELLPTKKPILELVKNNCINKTIELSAESSNFDEIEWSLNSNFSSLLSSTNNGKTLTYNITSSPTILCKS